MSLAVIEPVCLEGGRVRLEPISADHREGLWQAAQNPEIWRWTTHLTDSRAYFDRWVQASVEAWETGERQTFATIAIEPERVIGSSSFLAYRPDHDAVEIGSTWLDPAAWGTGANTEAKLLMMEHAFEALGCVRVEFKTDARNKRSRAALAGLPAQFEGILRKHTYTFGVGRRDSAYYSVTDDEWPRVAAALRARLAAGSGGEAN